MPNWVLNLLPKAAMGLMTGAGFVEGQAKAIAATPPPDYVLPPRYFTTLIVPAYNEEKYVGHLLDSVLVQTEPFNEVIVVDSSDGSGTADIATSYGATVQYFPKGNVAEARNYGARQATGTVLVFADADVVFHNKFLEKAVDALEEGYALAHPREYIYDALVWNVSNILSQGGIFRPKDYTSRCVAVWRDAFEVVEGYDETCNPLENCREDVTLGHRVVQEYGRQSIAVLPFLIATTARRQKHGNFGLSNWRTPIRNYLSN